tara:strand:+ start:2173 stop:3402 length:1230 start_codon:yes stop_codon:yes gene_type:complete
MYEKHFSYIYAYQKELDKFQTRSMNLIAISIIGISILTIFLLFIFQKKNKLMSDYMLIITIILIAGIFISNILVNQSLTRINLIFEKLIGFYILPAFLTYAMLLISNDNRIKRQWWWFGSFAIITTVFVFFDLFIFNDYNQESLKELYKSPPLLYHLFFRGSNVFAFIALLWFLKKLNWYHKKIKNDYSYIEVIRFKWLENFTWMFFINNFLILLISLTYSFWEMNNIEILYLTVYISIVISLFYLCYNGIRQYSLVEYENSLNLNRTKSKNLVTSRKLKKEPLLSKYKSSSLSKEEMDALSKQIKELFEVEEIYLEPQLKMDEIVKQLQSTTHKVSQTINSKTGKSFYDYVNQYRVEHFKKLLSNPDNRKYTVLALGIESGFNSKASLNRIFKQHTGISPKEFQKKSL